jgi:hypothetical protein
MPLNPKNTWWHRTLKGHSGLHAAYIPSLAFDCAQASFASARSATALAAMAIRKILP